jgi:2-keto-4-pentenoate hydratase/2-oxohepta-3-ene-1,7-dioic acid hydratase in catechol pathway
MSAYTALRGWNAAEYVFGVTTSNDLVDREWFLDDRAKGSDDFGPIGPAIVTGLDYGDLKLETRVAGRCDLHWHPRPNAASF